MNKPATKPLVPCLTAYYKQLEQTEQSRLKVLRFFINSHHMTIKNIIHRFYEYGTDGERLNGALLQRKAPKELIDWNILKRDQMRDYFPAQKGNYPLTVLSFDRLNTLDNLKATIMLSELYLARTLSNFIAGNEDQDLTRFLDFLEEYYEWQYEEEQKKHREIGRRSLERVDDALFKQAVTRAAGISSRILQSLLRGQNEEQTAAQVIDYCDRQVYNTTARIIYTEDTRITEEAAIEALFPFVDAFFTVCVHDGKTCPVCLDIERTQAAHPVDIALYEPEVTAPPFHPYCRCMIEVTWASMTEGDTP